MKRDYEKIVDSDYIDIESLAQYEINDLYRVLDSKMQSVYDFVLAYNDYMNYKHDYDKEEKLTMMEVHILTDICDIENLTTTILAEKWNRSVSATSKTVQSLVQKELITRTNSSKNARIYYLKPTQKGKDVAFSHKKYDIIDTVKTIKKLKKHLSYEEIYIFFKALDVYTELMK